MQTAMLMDIQKRHVEQSRWTDIREYAAEMLRREEAKKPTKSRRILSSQQKSVSRKTGNAKQQTKRLIPKAAVPVITNERQQNTPLSNDIAYQQLEQIILQDRNTNHAVQVDGIAKDMQAPPVRGDLSLYGSRDTDGEGMDDASFQELLGAVETGLQILSRRNAANSTLDPLSLAPTLSANYHRRGIITRDSLSAGSQRSSNETQNYLNSCLNAMRNEDNISLEQELTGLHMAAAKDKLNENRKEPTRSTEGEIKSPEPGSHAIADGVSKKGKPTKKTGSLKKKDFICPYDGCGKAFERRYNLKVHTRRHTGEMPYTCPKTSEGCFLYFRWRSSLRHHLKTVHNDVVPISQNSARARVTPSTVIQTTKMVSGKNTCALSSISTGTNSTQSCGSPTPGASKNCRIKKTSTKKQTKARKNFPAVAVRQPTAQELAQLSDGSLSKSSIPATPTPVTEQVVRENKDGMENSAGVSNEEDDIFKGMDVDVPDHFALPTLCDLPSPEDFFHSA